jgi:hypothetical protein
MFPSQLQNHDDIYKRVLYKSSRFFLWYKTEITKKVPLLVTIFPWKKKRPANYDISTSDGNHVEIPTPFVSDINNAYSWRK